MAVFGVLMLALAVFGGILVFFGWIFPLVIALRRRSAGQAGGRLLKTAVGWGACAVIVAAAMVWGIVSFRKEFIGYSGSSAEEKAEDGVSRDGPTVAWSIPYPGDVTVVVADPGGKTWRFTRDGNSLRVPAETLRVNSYRLEVKDPQARTWTVQFNGYRQVTNLNAAAVDAIPFGPPLNASVQVQSSPLSPDITITPVYADANGREYEVSCSDSSVSPSFEFVDKRGRVAWTHTFEHG